VGLVYADPRIAARPGDPGLRAPATAPARPDPEVSTDMADNTDKTPSRSARDKEASRQQSRAVSGKEAAKGVSGKPGSGQKGTPKGAPAKGAPAKGAQGRGAQGRGGTGPARGGPAKGATGKGGGGGQRPPRPRNAPAQRGPRRSTTPLLTWGLVGIVVIVVIAVVVVVITRGNTTTSGPAPTAVTSTVAKEVTTVPASVFDQVGISSPTDPVTAPHVASGQPLLKFGNKPGVFYMGGEFCPFCAAERWALVVTMSRFGSISGLQTMQSSSTDVYPSTQTFTLVNAKYTSKYLAFEPREYYSNQEKPTGGGYTVLQTLNKQQAKLLTTYNTSKFTGGSSTSSGSIPFIDFGNKAIISGASYSPAILQGLSRQEIAGGLTTAKSPVTKAIVASANYMSAATCATDGQQPASVCKSKGVTEADKAMGLTS
jgi:hypothetical protein